TVLAARSCCAALVITSPACSRFLWCPTSCDQYVRGPSLVSRNRPPSGPPHEGSERSAIGPRISCAVRVPPTACMVPWRGHTWPQAVPARDPGALASTTWFVRPQLLQVYVVSTVFAPLTC